MGQVWEKQHGISLIFMNTDLETPPRTQVLRSVYEWVHMNLRGPKHASIGHWNLGISRGGSRGTIVECSRTRRCDELTGNAGKNPRGGQKDKGTLRKRLVGGRALSSSILLCNQKNKIQQQLYRGVPVDLRARE